MLRITSDTEANKTTLKLEGELTGIWVSELFEAWRGALATIGLRALCIDLSAVSRVDKAGEYLLALMRCTSGTQLVGSGILMAGLIDCISRDWPTAHSTAHKEA